VLPTTATAIMNGQVQFVSTDAVTWSLAAGSTGTINSAGLYTAPASFAAKNVMDGCMLRPNDDIFNTRIDSLPIDANSNSRITHMLGGTTSYISFEISFPHNVLSAATPTSTMTFQYTPNANGQAFPILPTPYTGVESGLYPANYFNQDRHILGVSTTTCQFYELYNYYPQGANGSCASCNSQAGVSYSGLSYNLPDTSGGSGGGVDAAGMEIQPLALRYSELKAGSIRHALRFTMDSGDLFTGFIWPAVANATPGCTPIASCFPYGARLRLKPSFNISSYSQTTQTILRALQQYGMILTDGGTALHMQSMTDVLQDTTTFAAINSEIFAGHIASQFNFDQVDESSLMVSTASGKVNLVNPYTLPDNYAEVLATKISDGSITRVRIAIQPVTVGTYNIPFPANAGALSVMAGMPQFQIPYWVEGATTTTVTCSMTNSTGTLTSGCLYTAPANSSSMTVTQVTITPTADAAQAITFPLTVFPSDAIRINAGGKSAANNPTPPYDAAGNYGPDATGKYWWSDPTGSGLPWYGRIDGYYPQTSWPSSTDVGLYYTYDYDSQDGAYEAMVPNGAYNLTMGFGSDSNNVSQASISGTIDSQGSQIVSSTTLKSVTGATSYTPTSITIPITVVNNQFYFAIRWLAAGATTLINKWILTPTGVPVINSPLTASGQVNVPFSYQITATGSPGSFGATPLPAGLSVNVSGLITGTPTTQGVTNTTISASNANGTGNATLVITIAPASAPLPPPITINGNVKMTGAIKLTTH
jgi:hypothetical protein